MRQRFVSVTAAVAVTALLAAACSGDPVREDGVGDVFYPNLGNPGYDALHYDIDLDVDPDANFITARTTMSATAAEDLSVFNLDLLGLEIHSLAVNGIAAPFKRIDHEVIIEPDPALAAGSSFEVTVEYSGTPMTVNDPGIPFATLGWNNRDDVIYTASEPSGSMTWFPSNNHPTDKATFEIDITVPEGLTAASNGLLVAESSDDGRTTFSWRMDDLMATYLAAVYIGDFERIDYGPLDGDGPLRRDYVHSTATPETIEAIAVASDAIRFFEEILGPYPFDAYGTIVMPFDLGFALEQQTLALAGNDTLASFFIAHEVAHEWFGNSSSLEQWNDIWLLEGPAYYLELIFEADYHDEDFDELLDLNLQNAIETELVAPKGIEPTELFNWTVYARGALTLHALRLHAGDEVFFEILRTHYERSAAGNTDNEEFLALVNDLAGAEAVDVVNEWLLEDMVPEMFPGHSHSSGSDAAST